MDNFCLSVKNLLAIRAFKMDKKNLVRYNRVMKKFNLLSKKNILLLSILMLTLPILTHAKIEKTPVPVTEDKILDSNYFREKICDENLENCYEGDLLVKYDYISNKEAEVQTRQINGQTIYEEYQNRTKNSVEFIRPDGKKQIEFYQGEPFYYDNGLWFQVETGYTDIPDWEEKTEPTLIDQLSGIFVPIKGAIAQTTYYPSIDFWITCYNTSGTWSECVNEASADGIDTTTASGDYIVQNQSTSGPQHRVRRGFFHFDTSAIDDSATVDSASLSIWFTSNGGSNSSAPEGNLAVFESTADDSSPGVGDFDEHGTVVFSDYHLASGLSTGQYTDFTLNEDGEDEVNVLGISKFVIRGGHDYLDSQPGTTTYVRPIGYMSEQTGTSNDPKLVVTLEEVGGGGGGTTSTSTVPTELPVLNDFGFITGVSIEYSGASSTGDYTVHYYHIPFFVWIILAVVVFWLAGRILLELIIRWRQ